MKRRTFLSMAASGVGAMMLPARDAGPRVLPPWRPGEMDLHFIYTGLGENMFHIYPDGTTLLLDTGDFQWGEDARRTPVLPSREFLGGEWTARYIQRIWKKPQIDYLFISHWHNDHVGEPHHFARVTPDGRRLSGIASVGEVFRFGTFFDHQSPRVGHYKMGREETRTSQFVLDFVARAKKEYGLRHVCLEVGSNGQIVLNHDAQKTWSPRFSVRSICANGVVWDGKDGREDLGAVATKNQKAPYIPQNTLSAALRIDYGRFSYFTGGDLSRTLTDGKGQKYDYEGYVGRRVGRVSVCKANHHACADAMSREFVDAVKAKLYVNNVWCPSQANPLTTARMVEAGGFVCHTYADHLRKAHAHAPWAKGMCPVDGHVVVRVAPGGDTFKVFVLSARDESMRILWEKDFVS